MSKAVSTRDILGQLGSQLKESVGIRESDAKPQLSPVASKRDVGRRLNRKFGRVSLDRVIADPDQPRSEFDAAELEQLAESLKSKGQIAPIRVRWSEKHEAWMIVAGERRFRASKLAGLDHIDCYFHDDGLTRSEILEEQLIENIVRADLRPIEEAKSFEELMKLNDWGMRELSRALSISPAHVSRTLALLKLPEAVQQQVDAGKLSARAGYELSKLDSVTATEAVANVGDEKLSHADTVKIVRRNTNGAKPPASVKQTFVLEDDWRVTVSRSKHGTLSEVAEALRQALDEVEHRLDNDVSI